ncbi:MAG: PHP domain-containing protein [Treponema sp.]|nr:PHP domain-containing protein [Treponema sp.]
MSKIDLHIHSRFSSDGEIPVNRILEMCSLTGMKLVSITDHNSVEGVSEAMETTDVEVVPGVELDCIYRGLNLHLLGYGFDHTNKAFLKIEEDILNQEKDAGEKRIRLFQKATGIPLDIAEILNSEHADIISGELIAEHALAIKNIGDYDVLKPYLPGGEKADMPYVRIYWDFFAPDKPAYVPIRYISLPDAIKLIHNANGMTVLAHPGQNLSGNFSLLPDIISEGLDGIEVYSSYHSAEDAAYFLDIAKQNRLLVSCGSDFHGKNKPAIQLGGHGALLDDEEIITSFHHKLIGEKK